YPQAMTNQMTGIPPSNNLLYQTSSTNPFQNTRWPMPDANNMPGCTNYPIVPVTVS
ncbi:unnamed protein product, partial [Rotaria magnacalcarata]